MASSTKSEIYFFFKKQVNLRDRTKLKKFIEGIFKKEGRGLKSVNFIFCSDEELLAINQRYLKHDFYTDIVSFQLSNPEFPIEGEVYISADRLKDNAMVLGESTKNEIHRVIFHGILHFCGYMDKTAAQKRKMRTKEDYYLAQYFKK